MDSRRHIDWQQLSKPQRLTQIQSLDTKVPRLYQENDIKEELVLEYVRGFERQYYELFPTRPPLVTIVKNEYGVRKFISTFIKPTLLPFSSLYSYASLTTFLHHYLTYEPLSHAQESITTICSPTTTFSHQKGDCFDLCLLYCSLLIGAGYNAYVVTGRARGSIARGTRKRCPYEISESQVDYTIHEHIGSSSTVNPTTIDGSYMLTLNVPRDTRTGGAPVGRPTTKDTNSAIASLIPPPPTQANQDTEAAQDDVNSVDQQDDIGQKKSKYQLKKRIKLVSEFDQQQELEKHKKKTSDSDEDRSDDHNQHHPDDVYIHAWILILPNSRDIDRPFFIETSTGEYKDVTDPDYIKIESVFTHENYWVNMQETSCAETSFELDNLDKWEYIFIDDPNEEEKSHLFHAEDEMGKIAEGVESGEHDQQILDLPRSWVSRISLTQEQFQSKYPGKQKVIEYQDALVRFYAPYFREDCLTKHFTLYTDTNRTKVSEEHFYFENRKDKLIRRSIYNVTKTNPNSRTHEWFAPGRRKGTNIEALREVIQEKGVKNHYGFYWDARLDGLESRVEQFHPSITLFPKKVITTFRGRPDFLSYRSATYDVEMATQASDSYKGYKPIEERPVIKMTEKFERNYDKIADEDVAKRTYFLTAGSIRLWYHYGEDKITHATREYTKRGDMSIDIVDPFMARPKLSDAIEEFKQLVNAEKNCEANIRASNIEIREILETRSSEENSVERVTSIYDTLLNQPTPEEIEEMKRKERERLEKMKRRDVLGSLYPKAGIHSEDQAREIFKKALRSMRKRLLERAKILENRLNHERNQVNRRRTAYQKTQEASEKNEEEFLKFWEETMFRMRIIRDRVERNKVESKKEYAMLQEELLNDPRLSPWLSSERQKFYANKNNQDMSDTLSVSTRQ